MKMKAIVMVACLCLVVAAVGATVCGDGATANRDEPLCSTFSICALDPATGETGVAVTTRLPEVGRLCPFAKAGVGAVATQSYVVVRYGPDGLALLEKGMAPEEVLQELLKDDEQRERRQIGIIDAKGRTSIHTGTGCVPYAGHRAGKNYTVQGNLLVGKEVIDATADAFEASDGLGLELADRLIGALEAGQRAGGDRRTGQKQSAAVVVADPRRKHLDGSNILVNMQVAEHPEPVGELRRQYGTIRQKLGHRTFRLIEGPDVRELKNKLHDLGYYMKDSTPDEFRAEMSGATARIYDAAAADAVDQFRKQHGLPVPGDGSGHGRGIVDEAFFKTLRTVEIEKRKAGERPEAGERRPPAPS